MVNTSPTYALLKPLSKQLIMIEKFRLLMVQNLSDHQVDQQRQIWRVTLSYIFHNNQFCTNYLISVHFHKLKENSISIIKIKLEEEMLKTLRFEKS